jgi:hypothetical protein
MGVATTGLILAIPSGGTSLALTATATAGTYAFSLHKMGEVTKSQTITQLNDASSLPSGALAALGYGIGGTLGNEDLGRDIGGFLEAAISGKDVLKLGRAFRNQESIKIMEGFLSMYEIGSNGHTMIQGYIEQAQQSEEANE